MKPLGTHNYYTYILTNISRRVLYVGVTNSLENRLAAHKADAMGEKRTFTGKYNCYHLIYYEHFQLAEDAIARETEIKGWTRARKDALINSKNPDWDFIDPMKVG